MRKIKLLSLLAALLFSAGMYVQATVASGTCGTDLAWSLSDDYALTFSGTGTTMTDYSPASPAPWDAYKASISSITLPDGLYQVGAYAFAGCNSVTTLTVPESVSVIGSHAFDMANLASLYVKNHSMPPSRGQEAYSEIFPGHAANHKIYFHQDMVDWFCQSWVPSFNI